MRVRVYMRVRALNAPGEESFTFKIADEGGGIRRSELADIWSYKGSRHAHVLTPCSDTN